MVSPTMEAVAEIPRNDPDLLADERRSLAAWVGYQRATFLLKCHGLTDEQLALRVVPPSSMSLLGLMRHLTEVERNWFARHLMGADVPPLYYSDASPDGDFDDLASASVSAVRSAYQAAVARSEEVYDSFARPDELSRGTTGRPRTVRWVMMHVVEEYARHNGHADLLREAIDGARGE